MTVILYKERAVDAGEPIEDGVERFAADLRKLRVEAGSPTYERLRNDTGISKSVLTEAFGGRALPSARTVDAIVRACDGDVNPWLDRRDAIARSLAPDPLAADAPAPRTWGRRTAVLVAAGAFVAGAVLSGGVATVVASQIVTNELAAAGVASAPQVAVATGEDPAFTSCVDDAAVATGDTRIDNSLIEIIWSNKCYAGWARITRYDGLYEGNTVTIAIYPETAPNGPDRQEATEHDVQGAYTTLVVRPSPETLLCAEGSFTVDGKRIDLGDPICI